jgi:NADPH:quinone reductase-like Zn-dependent oxidoreductase
MTPTSIVHEADENQNPSFMMAWRVHAFGPPDVMRFVRVPRPSPDAGEVLVKVEAVEVGPWDGWIRAGKSALPQPLPLTLGSDLSGEIKSGQTVIIQGAAGNSVSRNGITSSCDWPSSWRAVAVLNEMERHFQLGE